MKGDITRQTFDRARHFSSVRLQQGRLAVDADFNEQADLVRHRAETEAADVIGGCGGPLDAAAFGVVTDLTTLSAADRAGLPATLAAGDFALTPGRYYVGGTLCELERAVLFSAQPDRAPQPPVNVAQAGSTVVYLDVWQRHLTWLDDPLLREVALGGPDTATRSRTVWQVKTAFSTSPTVTCVDTPAAYAAAIAPSTGRLAARARREAATPDPCLIPASAGYSGLENQLYRVEILRPGDPYDLTAGPGDEAVTVPAADKVVYGAGTWTVGQAVEVFRSAAGSEPMEGWLATVIGHDAATKTLTLDTTLPDLGPADAPRLRPVGATYVWSRDNGSVVRLVTGISGRELTVAGLGADDAPGQWVELSDELTELEGKPGFLTQIAALDRDARTVTLRSDPPAFAGTIVKLRRWDGAGAVKTRPPGGAEPFVELENGVQIAFDSGSHHTADHWLIPARTATAVAQSGTIEWPVEGGQPALLRPAGIEHRYCKLAVLRSNGTALTVEDCRGLFPPLTQLTSLLYVGGDGQQARPGQPLPQRLQASVFRGRRPVAGARVRFRADTGGALAGTLGTLPAGVQEEFVDTTNANGLVSCAWRPANDLARLSQTVEARLLDPGGTPIGQPLRFSAQLSVAAEVAYVPSGCPDLATASTVQQALDILCARPRGGESCCHLVRPDKPLAEEIKRLIEEGHRHVCVCLEEGEHGLEALVLNREQLDSLTIESCDGGARVVVSKVELTALEAFTLRNVEVQLKADEPIRLLGVDEVTVDDCRLMRVEKSGPVLSIVGSDRVRISRSVLDGQTGVDENNPNEFVGNVLTTRGRDFKAKADELGLQLVAEDRAARADLAGRIMRAQRLRRLSSPERNAWVALSLLLDQEQPNGDLVTGAVIKLAEAAAFAGAAAALALLDARAETLIEGSELRGGIVLFGERAGEYPEQELPKLARNRRTGALRYIPSGSLHVQDTRLSRIGLSEESIDGLRQLPDNGTTFLPFWRSAHLGDVEVQQAQNAVVAMDVTFTGTDFLLEGGTIGFALGESVIVSACRGGNSDTKLLALTDNLGQAANVRLAVSAL